MWIPTARDSEVSYVAPACTNQGLWDDPTFCERRFWLYNWHTGKHLRQMHSGGRTWTVVARFVWVSI